MILEGKMNQIEMVTLDELVDKDHSYRQINKALNFEDVDRRLSVLKKDNPHEGYGLNRLFKCIFLQYLENLSDRELERFLKENTAAKWFCGFGLTEKTPDYSVFSNVRKKIGAQMLSKIFEDMKQQQKKRGYMNEVFTFIDATHLISKGQLWKERDELIRKKYEKMNNENIIKVAADKEARFGCKGKDMVWIQGAR